MSSPPAQEPEIVVAAVEQISAAGVGLSTLLDEERSWPSARERPVLELPPAFDIRTVTGWSWTAELRQQDDFCRQTVACAKLVLDRADELPEDMHRRGVVLGTAYGATESECRHTELVVTGGAGNSSPSLFRNAVSNAVLGHLAVAFRFAGFSSLILNGGVSGLHALGLARQALVSGWSDLVLAGATDRTPRLIRQRFTRRLEATQSSPCPLVDGSCFMLLRHRKAGEQGRWVMRSQAIGYASTTDVRQSVERTLSRAVRGAGLRSEDLELALVHGPRGACFCDARRAAEACLDQCGAGAGDYWPQAAGATALPLMLNLCLALHWAPRGRLPRLIGKPTDDLVQDAKAVRQLLVIAVDASGTVAVTIFVHV